jgi:hypothetical protein
MSALSDRLMPRQPAKESSLPAEADPPAPSVVTAPPDAFPHTRRPLPWCLAAFLVMLFTVPIDSTTLNVNLPVGSEIDRFGIVALVAAWFVFGGDQRAFRNTHRSRLFSGSALLYLAVALISLLLGAQLVIHLNDLNQHSSNEFMLAVKRFSLLCSFLILAWFTMSAVRYEDLRGFTGFLIGLASVTAVGMLIERHTGYNVFYAVSATLLHPIATVGAAPTNIHPGFGSDGRVIVVGPTLHGLAATTLLMIVAPFALVRAIDAGDRRTRLRNSGAALLMLAAAMATDRKTALLVPIAIALYMGAYRPRLLVKYLPVALVILVGVVHVAAPGALGALLNPSSDVNNNSTAHREGDFQDLRPDVISHLLIGRGFGTLDPDDPQLFRINDNEYLDEIWEAGVIGVVAYAAMILAPILLARRAILAGDREQSQLALAASAGCVSYFVVSGLFDAFSFPQAPYLFFVAAALTTVAAAGPEPAELRERAERVRTATQRPRAQRARELPA